MLNQLSLYQLESQLERMPAMKSVEFEGGAYHAAGAPSWGLSDAVQGHDTNVSLFEAKMPRLPAYDADD